MNETILIHLNCVTINDKMYPVEFLLKFLISNRSLISVKSAIAVIGKAFFVNKEHLKYFYNIRRRKNELFYFNISIFLYSFFFYKTHHTRKQK